MMKFLIFSVIACAMSVSAVGFKSNYAPVTFQAAGGACADIQCKPLECQPPFKWVSAEDNGSCCALCMSDTVAVPEDRSWAKGLSGGVGPNRNADQAQCRGVMCPVLHCEEVNQKFEEGRCCSTC